MAVLIVATVSPAPVLAEGQPPRAPSQLTVDGAPASDAESGTTPNAQAGSDVGARTGEGAAEVGSRLHDSAKTLGDVILDGIKYVEHTVTSVFTGSKSK